ncbi:hypothetical protein CC86DRAFT_97571 [Ophiobolus disseminans]|uniref:Uncharacterized protein n=1 Tax=Ophiobolus disseminans TaxID=1469910 RepID=A0A6A6ZPQ4_9PLEO|nr:hypothetical protein CC86DRAFT_97571 [Ophiobolus disseminans]
MDEVECCQLSHSIATILSFCFSFGSHHSLHLLFSMTIQLTISTQPARLTHGPSRSVFYVRRGRCSTPSCVGKIAALEARAHRTGHWKQMSAILEGSHPPTTSRFWCSSWKEGSEGT